MFGTYAWAWKWNDTWHHNVPVIFFWRSRKTAELNIESSCVGRAPVSELRWCHSCSVTSWATCEKPRASPKLYVLLKTCKGFFPFSHSLNAEKFSHKAKRGESVWLNCLATLCAALKKKVPLNPELEHHCTWCAASKSIYKTKGTSKQCFFTESPWDTQVYSFCNSLLGCSYLLSSSQRVIWVTITACACSN